MGLDVRVTGGAQLRDVQQRLRALGDRGLGRQMGAALRAAAKPLKPAVVAEVPRAMPSGYAPTLSRSLRFRTAVKESRHSAGVTVRVYGDGRRERRDVPSLNRGTLRHPLYGNRARWFAQRLRPGFVDRPYQRLAPAVRREMQAVIDDVARQIGAS